MVPMPNGRAAEERQQRAPHRYLGRPLRHQAFSAASEVREIGLKTLFLTFEVGMLLKTKAAGMDTSMNPEELMKTKHLMYMGKSPARNDNRCWQRRTCCPFGGEFLRRRRKPMLFRGFYHR